MRVSNYLTNSEVFLAAICGLLLAPILYVAIIALHVIAELIAG